MARRSVLSRLAMVAATTLALGMGSATAQAAARACPGNGDVLTHRDGIVVFSAHKPDTYGNVGGVFVCSAASATRAAGVPREIYNQNASPKVTKLSRAGHFVGFFLRTNAEVYSRYLVVFDKHRDRIAYKDVAECDGNDECDGPSMTSYRLASNGWVAELWPGAFSYAAGLLATNGGAHYQLDITRISHLKLSGDTLSWTSQPFGSASVALGSGVITPESPQRLSACELLSEQDLAPLLGSSSSSSSAGQCTYTSSTYSGRQLTTSLKTGLTPKQMLAAENSGDYCQPGFWWPTSDNFFDEDGCTPSGGHFQFESFSNGAELRLDLVSGPAGGDELEAHLATVALDHLFGVSIQRAH